MIRKALAKHRARVVHSFFNVSVVMKGVNGAIEVIAGLFLLFLSPNTLWKAVMYLTQDELVRDPHDLLSNFLVHLVSNLSIGAKVFAALYLLIHGVIKIVLVFHLLRGKLQAYPISMGILGAFALYEFFRFFQKGSPFLLVLGLFDIAVILLIRYEYAHKLKHKKEKPASPSLP